jgi:hypothetical protein
MDLGSILIILALTLVTVFFIGRPFLSGVGMEVTEMSRRLSALLAERDRVLTGLEELDMDHAMGKVLQEDYLAQRGSLVSRGAEVLRVIDELQESDAGSASETVLEAEIEAEIARLRGRRVETDSGFCGSCGGAVVAGDRYCTHCGELLHSEEAQA